MNALDGISLRSRICLLCATLIMLTFFVFKTLVAQKKIAETK